MQVLDTPSTTRPFASTTPTPLSPVTVLHQSPQSILDRRQPAAKLHHPPSLLSSPAISTPSLCTVADEPLSSTSFRLSSMTCPSSSSSLQSSSSSRLASSSSCPVGVVHTHSRNGVTSGVASALPFVPLTPIMGSPRLTPDIGAAAGSVVGGGAGDGSGGGGKTGEPSQRPDYLNRGRVGALVERTGSRQDVMFDSMETWSDGDEHGDDVLRPWSASSGSAGAGTASVAGAQSSWQISSKRRSKSRFAGISRTSNSMVHRSQPRTSPRGIELGTLPGYEPLPPLSLSPEFRRMEAEMARMDLQGHTVGMTSAPASSSSSSSSKAAGPESGGPRVFDESASPNSYSSSASTAAGIPIRTSTGGGARSSSSPPAFSPVSTRLHRESLPPAFVDTATTTTTTTTTTTPRAKRRRSGSRHSRRLRSGPADTAQGNDLEEYTLVEEYTYERKYSRSDDAVHLLRQHRWVDRQTGTGTHERERSRWIFKQSFESANNPSGSLIHPENDMLVDVEDVLDSDGEGAVGCLRPSLSRKGRSRRVKPKVSLSLSLASNQEREARRREESVGSGWGRKMFIVGDGEGSDAENDNDNDTNGCEAEKRSAEEDMVDVDAEEERRERDSRDREERQTTRRYHALLELVTTELGYLQDLRALVSIYLQQLPLLDVPIPTTLSKSTPSSLSISNLGLSRPFPSSRSFLHTSNAQHPGPGPPSYQDTSTSPPSASDRHRDAFDGERTREIESAFLTVTPKDATTHTTNHTTKPSRRPLFSEQDVQLITRNASELLAVHETFVKMLKYALEPHGFGEVFAAGAEMKKKVTPVEDKEEVDNAAKAVMELFCQQASSFEVYEPFCPGHNEATDLIRTVQEHHPVEWDAFEQRCSLRVSHAFDHQGSPSMDSLRGSIKSKRRHSLSSLAMPMSLSPFGAVGLVPPVPLSVIGQAKSDTLANRHKRKGSGDVVSPSSSSAAQAANSQIGRLKFLDYLIKPVQRICKYPLLLDQLKVKCSESEQGEEGEEGLVEAACAAMRRVVALVDRASEKRTQTLKSNLIASRLLAECPASPTSPVHVTVDDRRTQLSTEFMQSLGMCMLAGALDVVYYQSNGSARAKYLATFLYPGGYVVLAKVPKGGKAYDPKHWFSLGGFEIVVDQEDDEALPYAFHLCSPTAQIHFAASCQLEKTIWIAAIQESLAVEHEPWVNEPTINLPTDIRPLVFATPEDLLGSEWSATPLPTIQSMSELETPADASNAPAPPTSSPTRKMHKTMSRADSLVLRQDYDMAKLNRRTSTTSVKAFFAPLTFDSRVTRPSSQIRQQVDNGLHDVLSETFVVVRSQVIMRDEELFQLRKKSGNVSRSNSALSISGAFGTRRQRDGVALSARRKGSMDGQIDLTNDYEGVGKATNLILARRSKSSSAKIKKQRLSLLPSVVPPMPTKVDQDENLPVVERSQSPSPLTRGPSAASSNTNSVLPSPIELTMPLPTPGSIYNRSPDSRRADRPKRTRSMVDNVKYFFHSRSTSPTPSFPYQQSPRVSVVNLDVESETHGGLIQWWRRGSIRRRAQSSPDAATDDSAPVTPAASSSDDSSHTDLQAITDGDLLSASPPNDRRRHVSFSRDRTTLSRRRSLFASSSFTSTTRLEQPSSLKAQNGQLTLAPSQTFKNFFTFQRSPSQPGDIN